MYTLPYITGHGAAWLARFVRNEEAPGSNPGAPTVTLKTLRNRLGVFVSQLPIRGTRPLDDFGLVPQCIHLSER
jgi:hypothetical protein